MPPQPAHELDDLAARFMTHRPRLFAIAYRTLGSPWPADDAVQETWLRLQRADISAIRNLEAWLTTVVSRVCIDLIRQRVSRREEFDDGPDRDTVAEAAPARGTTPDDPSDAAVHTDAVAVALQVLLETLGPAERLAFVLHDLFALTFEDISPIVERTPAAARQLASRARARLRHVDVSEVRVQQDSGIAAFLDASRRGDFGRLLQLLDPEVELRSDDAAVALARAGADDGAPLLEREIRGVDAVARVFAGRAALAFGVHIEGMPAAAYITDGTVHAVYLATFSAGRIIRLDALAAPHRLAALQQLGPALRTSPAAPATE